MNNNLISKANEIIEASYRLSLNEQRVLLACIAQVDSRSDLSEDTEIKLSVKDFAIMFNTTSGRTYEYLKEGADRLGERGFKVRTKGNDYSEKISWTSSVKYYDNQADIGVFFNKRAIPYITNLKGNFTSYRMKNISQLTSVYAIRLYEILIRWRKIGKVEFKIDDFRKSLDIKPNEYKRMSNFKIKVLKIAIDQINEHTDINCRYTDVKKGKRITGFIFHFGKDTLTQIELEDVIADAKKNLS